MLTCPMCKKKLRGLEKECLNCRTDVSLLVDYVENLRDGLVQAEALTRAGELGDAVWAYLAVLEVDPDNAQARRQVGKVATAVRQFDRTAPGRRWLRALQKQTRFRRWLARWNEGEGGVISSFLWFLVVFAALMVGYLIGSTTSNRSHLPAPTPTENTPNEPPKEDGAKGHSMLPRKCGPVGAVLASWTKNGSAGGAACGSEQITNAAPSGIAAPAALISTPTRMPTGKG